MGKESNLKHILISAGEASGDMHAAKLIQTLQKQYPDIQFYGMGASLMQNAGAKLIVDANELSVIGLLEIITKFKAIKQAFNIMEKALKDDKPDLLILVDYPGFNLRLAKAAKKYGIKVLYFISPKVWAWNQRRVKIIKKYVDIMAVIFPFEVDFYKQFAIPAVFVGNPLLDLTKPKLSREQAIIDFDLDIKYKTIGLFPGSRKSEIRRLLPTMLGAAKILKHQNPDIQFILPQASSISAEYLNQFLQFSPVEVKVISGQNIDVMQVCDAIIAASGTATLEIAIMGIPLVIIYKTSWIEYLLAKMVIKIPYIGLCNILMQKKIVQELLQNDATAPKIAYEVNRLLNDIDYRQEMLDNFCEIKTVLANDDRKEITQIITDLIR